MEFANYVGLVIFAIGAALSIAVWCCGFFFRRRVRGPVRILMMTIFLVLWYLALWSLTSAGEYSELMTKPVRLATHSIWLWWAIAMFRIERQIRKEMRRSNFKSGVVHATGVHIVNEEIRRLQAKRRAERNESKVRQLPQSKSSPEQRPEVEI